MKNLFISQKVMSEYDCSEQTASLVVYGGELHSTSERHLLHRAIGSMGNQKCLEYFNTSMKDIQNLISNREILPLLEIGVLELMEYTNFCNVYDRLYCLSVESRTYISKTKNVISPILNQTCLGTKEKEILLNKLTLALMKAKYDL